MGGCTHNTPLDNLQELFGLIFLWGIPLTNIILATIYFDPWSTFHVSSIAITFVLIILAALQYLNELVPCINNSDGIGFDIFQLFILIIIPISITLSLSFKSITNLNTNIEFDLAKKHTGIDLEKLTNSFDQIGSAYEEIEKILSIELEQIKNEMNNTISVVQKKNSEIEELVLREQALIQQIRYQEQINSLSEKQTSALIKALQGNKLLDRFIGGIIGFLASLTVAIISNPKLLNRFKRNSDLDIENKVK